MKLKRILPFFFMAGAAVWGQQTPGGGSPNVKIVDGSTNERLAASSGKYFVVYLSPLTSTAAVVTDGTTTLNANVQVQSIFCINTAGSAVTVTMYNNAGTPVTYVPGVSLASNSVNGIYSSPLGLALSSGMQWKTGTTSAIWCQVEGVFTGAGGVQ